MIIVVANLDHPEANVRLKLPALDCSMITEFLLRQLDYVFLVYGLSFVLLGATCLGLKRIDKSGMTWIWLSLFGFIHGLNEWLDMIALSMSPTIYFSIVQVLVFQSG